jgi:sterol desaturase/sphingolipid hydroxylase (fatty acid hydroxylase superfamily)
MTFLLDHASSVQVFLFAIVLGGLWAAERIYRPEPTLAKLKHTGVNALFMSGVLPVQLSLIAVCIAAANWATQHHIGLLYLLPHHDSPWLRYGLMFVALDFLDYVYHVTSHRLRFIWRLHLVHHSDRNVDVSTTFREHPAETAIRLTFFLASVLACGASLEVLMLRQTVQTFSNVTQHARFDLPPLPAKVLGWVFVTPNLHHIHHHWRQPGTNCNYGDVFSIWDRLFGTYVAFPPEEMVFGLDSHMGERDIEVLDLLGWNSLVRWWTGRMPKAAERA